MLYIFTKLDLPEAWQMNFQSPATPIMDAIIDLHNDVMFFLVIIIVGVSWALISILQNFVGNKFAAKYLIHGTLIEVIWTITPALVLIAIALPSFRLLYLIDEVIEPEITLKAIGHQWYWSYEYSDYVDADNDSVSFDSYMIPEDDLVMGQFRLLEVDNRVVLPVNTHIRVIVSAVDVLHSWAVPSLGVKVDAVPGRLNQLSMFIQREGVYFGQCSEICGVNHGFMPIVVEAVSLDDYVTWIQSLD